MLYNIRYWWSFLSQGSQWTKYLVHPKIRRPKPCLQMLASLVDLVGFHKLLSTQRQPILLQSGVVYPCFIHCHIFTQKLFFLHWNSCKQRSESSTCSCFWSTVSKRCTHIQHGFTIENVHGQKWIHCLLIYSTLLLSHVTSIWNRSKWDRGVFGVFEDNCRI